VPLGSLAPAGTWLLQRRVLISAVAVIVVIAVVAHFDNEAVWYAVLAVLVVAALAVIGERLPEGTRYTDVAVVALIAPVVVALTALMTRYPGARVAFALVGAVLAAVAVVCAWRGRPANARVVVVIFASAAALAVVLFLGQVWLDNNRDGHLTALHLSVRLAGIVWLAAVAVWLALRLLDGPTITDSTERLRLIVAAGVTIVVPFALFLLLPVNALLARDLWILPILVAPLIIVVIAVVDVAVGVVLAAGFLLAVGHLWHRWPALFGLGIVAGACGLHWSLRRTIIGKPTEPVAGFARWTRVLAAAGALLAAGAVAAGADISRPGPDTHFGDSPAQWDGRSLDAIETAYAPVVHLDPRDDLPIAICGAPEPQCPARTAEHPSVYALVTRVGPPSAACESDPTVKSCRDRYTPVARNTALVIEYWLFYPIDQWSANTALGSVEQGHGADWEHVDIGFETRGGADRPVYRPTWVSYSSHCGGAWLPWSAANRTTNAGDAPALTHPETWVAYGSHANYPTSRRLRSPNWASCANAWMDRTVGAFSLGAEILEVIPKDTTGVPLAVVGDAEARTALTDLPQLGTKDVYSFQGWKTTPAPGGGVPTPVGRTIQTDPLSLIFGRRSLWHCAATAHICKTAQL